MTEIASARGDLLPYLRDGTAMRPQHPSEKRDDRRSGAQRDDLMERLKSSTRQHHEALDKRLIALSPFANRQRYACFLRAQHAFLREVERFYREPEIGIVIADASERSRLSAIEADLRDLDLSAARTRKAAHAAPDRLEGLGWLYVAEGSKLGAAFLLKEAKCLGLSETFGARHLAADADGRGRSWRTFSAAMECAGVSDVEQHKVAKGAQAAFDHFAALLEDAFARVKLEGEDGRR